MKIAKKIIAVVIVLFIVFGIFMTITKGINTGLIYEERNQIGIDLGAAFETSDIKNISKEVFGNEEVLIQKATIFEDTVLIQSKEITDENKAQLVEKINEKYNLNVKIEDVEIERVGAKSFKDDLKVYILPISLSLVIILVYFALRFKKSGVIRIIIRFITTLAMFELIYISVLSIVQIGIGRLFAPLSLMIYMITVIITTCIFEKERADIIISQEK